ncbi:Ribosome biogenesis protein BOP1-like protein [Frankliniella fusca]|uniref:Ribosome biogenesis protein BOP1-like protein n=1 Tax=Frankliniella fusca TaxID=407009 RepID=A0AAE1HK28_9NEOP|nr:Ribosome biogenesis protein BOP1-like protein [Frankliniella fusca]
MMKLKNCPKESKKFEVSPLLKELLNCAEENANKKANGLRYDEKLKEFSTLLYLVSSVQAYEILCTNLPFPGIDTVKRALYSSEVIVEGEFRFESLKKFLELHQLPNKVILSEDATKIAGRIQYHSGSNQVVGFTLPLDSNGLPIIGSYPATSAERMAQYFSGNDTSNYAYVIVAQPLSPKAPSFVLSMYGTNNKFTAHQTEKRWTWMKTEALKFGLVIEGHSSDGDTRLLKCMIYRTVTTQPDTNWNFFQSHKVQPQLCIQDHIHTATKLKSRLCKPSVIIPFGKALVSRGHLISLVETVSRDLHNICGSDIDCKDKMNYRAVQKLTNPKVTELLRKHVPLSDGTATYLEMISDTLDSFTDPSLPPLKRIEKSWTWVFFCRLWRTWIQQEEAYSLQHNFITANCYACIELNAHALIQAIIKFRDKEEPHLFLPWLMSSQPCESSFRLLRSSKAAHCGVVSFSILELQNRVRRIDFMTNKFKKLEKEYTFKRHHKSFQMSTSVCYIPVTLPEDYEIEIAVDSALKKAIGLAVKFEIIPRKQRSSFVPACQLQPVKTLQDNNEQQDESEQHDDDDDLDNCLCENGQQESSDSDNEQDLVHEEDDVAEDQYLLSTGAIGVKTYDNVPVSETGPYVSVRDTTGQRIVKKSTFLYLHSKGKVLSSSDRIVRYVSDENIDHRETTARKPFHSGLTVPTREESINLADWCSFYNEDKSVVVGRVLAFSYLSGATWKKQEFSWTSIPVEPPKKNARGVGCLCSWFKIGKNGILVPMNMEVHGYYSVEHYICTLPRPTFLDNGSLKISCSVNQILQTCKKK